MFGLKFKSWMETHIVRSRKKQQPQQRSKDDVSCSKVKLTRKSLPSFRTSPFIVDKDERFHHQDHAFQHDGMCGENIDTSSRDEIIDQFTLTPHQHHGSNNGTNLSSPESAYSTGYSTDGTSPGTTFLPEYYINIRTGTHYFHSEAAINCKPQSEHQVSNGNEQTLFCCAVKENEQFGNLLTKVKDLKNVVSAKKSVCDDKCGTDIISQTKIVSNEVTLHDSDPIPNKHHQHESCNESRRYPATIRTSYVQLDDGSDVIYTSDTKTGSTFLNKRSPTKYSVSPSPKNSSQIIASPRQRNKIRTNPWLSSNNTSSNVSIAGISNSNISSSHAINNTNKTNELDDYVAACPSRLEVQNCVSLKDDSSSLDGKDNESIWPKIYTIHQKNEENPRKELMYGTVKLSNDDLFDPSSKKSFPLSDCSNIFGLKTACSSCSSFSSQTTNNFSQSISSNLSDSNDDDDDNNNDDEDNNDDDLTLNEMLGKFDESYVYEKETDILSDNDPTDCEEDYDETDFNPGADDSCEKSLQDAEEFDFIDNGSHLEPYDTESHEKNNKLSHFPNGIINEGHCTYITAQTGVDQLRNPTMYCCESFSKRNSSWHQVVSKNNNTSTNLKHSLKKGSFRQICEESLDKQTQRGYNECNKYRKPNNKPFRDNSIESPVTHTIQKFINEKRKYSIRQKTSLGENLVESVSNGVNAANTFNGSFQKGVNNLNLDSVEMGGNFKINHVLLQKFCLEDCEKGSRSAGHTPIALRRLNSSGIQKGFEKNTLVPKVGFDGSDINVCSPLDVKDKRKGMKSTILRDKKHSFSINGCERTEVLSKSIPTSKYISNFDSELALIEADAEADCKYRKLILEAENILVNMKENMTDNGVNYMASKQKPSIDKIKRDTHGSIISSEYSNNYDNKGHVYFDNIKTDLQKYVMTKRFLSSPIKQREKNSSLKDTNNIVPFNLIKPNMPPKHELITKKSEDEIKREEQINEKHNHLLEPSSSEFDIFAMKQSEAQMSKPMFKIHKTQKKESAFLCNKHSSIVAYQSIDLGHDALSASVYCPQSEPVKRKVYTHNATFDKLRKPIEKTQIESLKSNSGKENELISLADGMYTRGSLKEKLEQLRHVRLKVESKVREAQEEERKRLGDQVHYQRQVFHFRQKMLVHTIKGLKRSLEYQSARLQETYRVNNDKQDYCET